MTNLTPWEAHCEIALNLKRRFGTPAALDYLVGEKFIGVLQDVAIRNDLRIEIPKFAEQIRKNFEPWELEAWFTKERKPASTEVKSIVDPEFDPELEADFVEAGLKRLFLVEDAAKWLLAKSPFP